MYNGTVYLLKMELEA